MGMGMGMGMKIKRRGHRPSTDNSLLGTCPIPVFRQFLLSFRIKVEIKIK